jgi:citrate synthase
LRRHKYEDERLLVIHETNGQQFNLNLFEGWVLASEVHKIKDNQGRALKILDPYLMHTAPSASGITLIDETNDDLYYRGLPIEQLAANFKYIEVVHLLLFGHLPTIIERELWRERIARHAPLPEALCAIIDAIPQGAEPMGALVSALGALASIEPIEAEMLIDPSIRIDRLARLIGLMPQLVGRILTNCIGGERSDVPSNISYTRLVWASCLPSSRPSAADLRLMETILIVHADHAMSCATHVLRAVSSAEVDPILCAAAAASALSGRRNGSASKEVLKMLRAIDEKRNLAEFIDVRRKNGNVLAGFGHTVYEHADPRANILRNAVLEFTKGRKNTLLDTAIELEHVVSSAEAIHPSKRFPSIEYYAAIALDSLGVPPEIFPLLFTIARTAGWAAHLEEMARTPTEQIMRPRQFYRHDYPIGKFVE